MVMKANKKVQKFNINFLSKASLMVLSLYLFPIYNVKCQIEIDSNNLHFLTVSDLQNGSGKWITNSCINEMINIAEQYFGNIDTSYIFSGIGFHKDNPQIYYPSINHIAIYLTPGTLTYQFQAYFQLSHEVFHLLSPTGKFDANNLEEGLAVYFSKIYFDLHGFTNYDWEGSVKASCKYYEAYLLTKQLLKIDPFIIKKIRQKFPTIKISYFTMIDFKAILGNKTPEYLLNQLLKPFPSD